MWVRTRGELTSPPLVFGHEHEYGQCPSSANARDSMEELRPRWDYSPGDSRR